MSKKEITYTMEKVFTQKQVEELFLSVGWISGRYPERLYKALMNSETVITAWDSEKLVGLIRALDDSEILAFIHFAVVHPDYQGYGIAGTMLEMMRDQYKDFLFIDVMPEESKNAPFYEKYGFSRMEDAVAMQRMNIENS